ncbi:unnamed protein product (mitochondrion) [Plasmodiophora brassicae]|uniref:Transmembrane protein n=1 Tax=Plasmodiophora brassicae TaxID=37360 RepID=A0A0G4IJJ7_PLABS|nr:hypothetical protein PBRA_004018 [Plasmodiophora brassicae]SPQ96296.1 unnamed protein product [Plasmodiophora brassicae]
MAASPTYTIVGAAALATAGAAVEFQYDQNRWTTSSYHRDTESSIAWWIWLLIVLFVCTFVAAVIARQRQRRRRYAMEANANATQAPVLLYAQTPAFQGQTTPVYQGQTTPAYQTGTPAPPAYYQ